MINLCLPGAPQSTRNAETGASVDLGALKVPRRDFALIEVRGVRWRVRSIPAHASGGVLGLHRGDRNSGCSDALSSAITLITAPL
jgi:hypothetical protein